MTRYVYVCVCVNIFPRVKSTKLLFSSSLPCCAVQLSCFASSMHCTASTFPPCPNHFQYLKKKKERIWYSFGVGLRWFLLFVLPMKRPRTKRRSGSMNVFALNWIIQVVTYSAPSIINRKRNQSSPFAVLNAFNEKTVQEDAGHYNVEHWGGWSLRRTIGLPRARLFE